MALTSLYDDPAQRPAHQEYTEHVQHGDPADLQQDSPNRICAGNIAAVNKKGGVLNRREGQQVYQRLDYCREKRDRD